MRPCFHSRHFKELGWHHDGQNMTYRRSDYSKEILSANKQLKDAGFYTFEFDYAFRATNDEVFVAFTVPYSYSKMTSHLYFLNQLSRRESKSLLT